MREGTSNIPEVPASFLMRQQVPASSLCTLCTVTNCKSFQQTRSEEHLRALEGTCRHFAIVHLAMNECYMWHESTYVVCLVFVLVPNPPGALVPGHADRSLISGKPPNLRDFSWEVLVPHRQKRPITQSHLGHTFTQSTKILRTSMSGHFVSYHKTYDAEKPNSRSEQRLSCA